MASPTQQGSQVVSSQTNGSGSSTTGTHDKSGSFDAEYLMRITNGGTAPSTPCDAIVYHSTDGSDWYEVARYRQDAGANETVEFAHQAPAATQNVQIKFEGNDDQDVTVEAVVSETTDIS